MQSDSAFRRRNGRRGEIIVSITRDHVVTAGEASTFLSPPVIFLPMSNITDLTTQAPRSPRVHIGSYPLLARAIDKGRATLNSASGEYHFNCPLDNFLFSFKGVKGDDVKEQLASGASDQEVADWLDNHGTPKTKEEIQDWAQQTEGYSPYSDPEKKEWFVGECERVGIDPATSTLFDMLEADDKASFKN